MKLKIGFALLFALACQVGFSQRLADLQILTPQTSTADGDGFQSAFDTPNDLGSDFFKPKKKKKKKKKTTVKNDEGRRDDQSAYNWKDHLWYGGNFDLQLQSSNNYSVFQIGVAPMVGYKITPWFSVGPRLGVSYGLVKQPYTQTTNQKTNYWFKTAGTFARIRFWSLFLHAEADQFWVSSSTKDPISGDKFKDSVKYGNQFLGIGYNAGREREWGYEVLVLYDVNLGKDKSYPGFPIEYRVGFTYNF